MNMRVVSLSVLAMLAFAGNSLLCRAALADGAIDAAGFTVLRVASGAVFLAVLLMIRQSGGVQAVTGGLLSKQRLWGAVTLACYMLFFSFAYVSLDAGTGALLLFGAVQLTMFVAALRGGERFAPLSWAGLAMAFGGLVWLVSPGVGAPDPTGAVMMVIAGIGWGFYSLGGRGAKDALANTGQNFILCLPVIALPVLLFIDYEAISNTGILLAVASGVVASGCGYAIWYAVLPSLSAGRAAVMQLTVPAIASFGGVLLLGEDLTTRLVLSSLITLGGVFLVITQQQKKA